MQTYLVRIRYTERVEGQPRSFDHEVSVVETSRERAADLALEYFNQLGRDSWVSWRREVQDVDVRPVRSRSQGAAGLTLQGTSVVKK